LHDVLASVFSFVAQANRYFTAQEPWKLAKSDPARRDTVLWVTLESLRLIGILTQAFMPDSSAKLLDLLAIPTDKRSFVALTAAEAIGQGAALPAPAPIFPRIEV